MSSFEEHLSQGRTYRALVGMALEYKSWFIAAIIGMAVFAAAETAFAYLMKPLQDEGFINRDEAVIKMIPFAIVGIFTVRMIAAYVRTLLHGLHRPTGDQ